MTLAEMAPAIVAVVVTGGLYLYLWNGSRRAREAREHRHIHPAE